MFCAMTSSGSQSAAVLVGAAIMNRCGHSRQTGQPSPVDYNQSFLRAEIRELRVLMRFS